MDEFGARVRREPGKHQIAIFTITDTSPDFDQFMIMQGLPEFADDAIGQAALADQHQRVQGVSEPPQVFFLPIRECHSLIIGPHAGIRS
jgi:hypothetical protein